MINVLLVDPQAAIRRGLRMRLEIEPDLNIAGEAGDGPAALSLAEELHPDAIILDIQMPGPAEAESKPGENPDGSPTRRRSETSSSVAAGIALLQALHRRAPDSALIVLSLRDDIKTRARAREAGAYAFLTKEGPPSHLIRMVRLAAGRR